MHRRSGSISGTCFVVLRKTIQSIVSDTTLDRVVWRSSKLRMGLCLLQFIKLLEKLFSYQQDVLIRFVSNISSLKPWPSSPAIFRSATRQIVLRLQPTFYQLKHCQHAKCLQESFDNLICRMPGKRMCCSFMRNYTMLLCLCNDRWKPIA